MNGRSTGPRLRVRAGVVPVRLGLLALLLCCAGPVSARQGATVGGRVTYSGNGAAIGGVQVVIPSLGLISYSDDSGRYRLAGVTPGRHEVVASYLSCRLASLEVDVRRGGHHAVDLTLSPPVLSVDGLVVTKEGTGASAGPVGAGEPGDRLLTNARGVGGMIQGRVAGAKVLQGSGRPGDAPSILLRGPRSIQGSQDPLLVIDGIVTRGDPADIDPTDVESIEILKGPAAAEYGSRGAAGVIRLRTKRGVAVQGPPERALMVDGEMSTKGLGDLDPSEIVSLHVLEGPLAAALYGARAEGGLIQVTTRAGSSASTRPAACFGPGR